MNLIKFITAIAAPSLCFFTAWSLARSNSTPPATSSGKPAEALVGSVAPRDDSTEMTALPEWDLVHWQERLVHLSAGELREMIRSISDGEPSDRGRLQLVATRLGELEGAGCLAFLEELPRSHDLINAGLNGWTKLDPRAALLTAAEDEKLAPYLSKIVWLTTLFDRQLAVELIDLPELAGKAQRAACISSLVSPMTGAPAEEALAWYARLTPGEQDPVRERLFRELARRDPVAMADAVAALPPGQARLPALSVAVNWARIDPQAAIAWSESLPQGDLAWDARRAALTGWIETDPTAVWDYLSGLEKGEMGALLEEKFDHSTTYALAGQSFYDHFSGSIPRASNGLLDPLLNSLQGTERAELVASLGATKNPKLREIASRAALVNLAKTDPESAIEQTADIDLGNTRQGRDGTTYFPLQPIIDSAAGNDLVAALNLALTFPEKHRSEAVSYSMAMLARNDPQSAREQIDAMEPGAARDAAFQSYAKQTAGFDPVQTAEDLSRYLESDAGENRGYFINDATGRLVGNWFKQDPQQAGEWVAQLQHPQARAKALEVLRRQWESFGGDTAARQLQALGFTSEEIDGR